MVCFFNLNSEAPMLTTNDWSYHIHRRDHCRLMSVFASNTLVAKHYEALAHRHGKLARRAFDGNHSTVVH